jgi:serine/threonine protein kinase
MSDDDTTTFYPQEGEILEDKYEIEQVIGTGAMGSVVRARHILRKVPVALKFMSPQIIGQRDVIDRFLNEGVAASKIDSEHVVKVLDVSKLKSGVPYMVMEFLEGEDLGRIMRRDAKPFMQDTARAVHFVLQMLRGLQAAHRVKIVHRDMKPANCFVIGKDGDADFIKIVDFGISKVRQEDNDGIELTHAGTALGTPLYMSLEQAKSPRDVDSRTDLYSVACILYELLGGATPFVPKSGTLSELFTMLAADRPRSLELVRDDLPPGLWQVVERGLEKDQEKRFQTAGAFAEALVPYSDERSDYIVSKMLRTTATGKRSMPPPTTIPAPPVTGTLLMQTEPSNEKARALPFTIDEGPSARVATTEQGTVREAGRTILDERRGTLLVWAIAVVAVVAVAAAAWAVGNLTAARGGDEVQIPTGGPAVPAPQPSLTPVAPASSTPEPPPPQTATVKAPPPGAPPPIAPKGGKKLKDVPGIDR